MRFDPSRSILAGMDTSAMQLQLNKLQQAYLDLSSGSKGVNYSYTQGDGAKAVTYTAANIGDLVQAIKLLQSQLGIVPHARRSFGVAF